MSRSGPALAGALLLAAPAVTAAGLRLLAGAIGALRGLVLTAAAVPLVTVARSASAMARASTTAMERITSAP